ncbi:MAG: response regulator [Cytophagales bacterium]|nr:MAG: response regulator [Cytophagales bacterium]
MKQQINIYFNAPIPNLEMGNLKFDGKKVEEATEQDEIIHDFVDGIYPKYDTYVIEFNSDNQTLALRLACYIFFFNEMIGILPIIILVGTSPINELSNLVCADILSAKNVEYIFRDEVDNLKDEIAEILSLISNAKTNISNDDLIKEIKQRTLNIPKPEGDNHSIANIWGAFKLAQVTNTLPILEQNAELQKKRKLLYFKYLLAKNEVKSGESEIVKINCLGKKVLLIDDEADKGWADIFNTILSNVTFEYVPMVYNNGEKDEAKFLANIEAKIQENWDVVLLDLRLTKADSASKILPIKEYSGYKILEKIKQQNKGTQVIVFTASNKAWNMKALYETEFGIDGYYIKESPDFLYGEDYTQKNFENFRNELEDALQRTFLKHFWKNTETLKNHIKIEYAINQSFINEVSLCLDYAYDTLENYHFGVSSQTIDEQKNTEKFNQKYLNYAFVGYCNLIEDILKNIVKEETSALYPNEKDWTIKSFSFASDISVITWNGSQYQTYLQIDYDQTITNHEGDPLKFYKRTQNLNFLSNNGFKRYQDKYGLTVLAKFSSVVLLKYGFDEHLVKEYEQLKWKRNSLMHNNEIDSIKRQDCEDIFKMVHILLKGVAI